MPQPQPCACGKTESGWGGKNHKNRGPIKEDQIKGLRQPGQPAQNDPKKLVIEGFNKKPLVTSLSSQVGILIQYEGSDESRKIMLRITKLLSVTWSEMQVKSKDLLTDPNIQVNVFINFQKDEKAYS